MQSALVVISHYNARPTDHLIALLDQVHRVPAGLPFRCRVVVNQAEPEALELPPRFAGVEVLYRENTGYNIGSWDFGWRQGPAADIYLFLQDECQIRRPGWLKAFADRLRDPGVGLVGERMNYDGFTWERADCYWSELKIPRGPDGPGEVSIMDAKREVLVQRLVPLGAKVGHLQSLVLATRREVLEAIDGFLIMRSYAYAIGAEYAISRQVETLGLKVRQVGLRPFRFITHPQWQHLERGLGPLLLHWVDPYLPLEVGAYFHAYPRRHRRIRAVIKQFALAVLPRRLRPPVKS